MTTRTSSRALVELEIAIKIRDQTYSSLCDLTFDIHLPSIISSVISTAQQTCSLELFSLTNPAAQAPHNLLGHSCILWRQYFIPFYTLFLSFRSNPTSHVPKHGAIL